MTRSLHAVKWYPNLAGIFVVGRRGVSRGSLGVWRDFVPSTFEVLPAIYGAIFLFLFWHGKNRANEQPRAQAALFFCNTSIRFVFWGLPHITG